MSRLINNGSIEEDYTAVVSRYRLARDLYVEEWHTIAGGADVNALRVHWSHKQLGIAGKAGDPDYVKKLVARLMAERGWTFTQIVEAGKKYIESCRNSGRIIRDLPNFLFDKDGSSMIAEFVEEGGQEESVNLQNDFL